MKKDKITEKMNIADIVNKKPASVEIMMKYGMHCIGCHMAAWETLEEGAKVHGMSKEKLKKMVEEINKK